jgi:aerobic-type carbon monoxide dehydrogenase small subunit (CoxS/CutS family)
LTQDGCHDEHDEEHAAGTDAENDGDEYEDEIRLMGSGKICVCMIYETYLKVFDYFL